MPREPFSSKKKKNSNLIWIVITTIVAFGGIGTIIYFTTTAKNSENKTPTTEVRVQQLQSQLAQIRTVLATLSHNIVQNESSLQTKRTEQAQTPSPNLQTEINQLEQKLTTYKAQKQKIETLLPKIAAQINNLSKKENNPQQESIIQNLEKDIQAINQELGIKSDKPKPTPRKLPDDTPNSTWESLIQDLKTVHDYLTEAIPRKESNPPSDALAQQKWQMELDSFKNGLQEIKQLQSKFIASSSPNQQEVIKTRTEIRKKWKWVFKDNPLPEPDKKPNPDDSSNPQTFQTLQQQVKEFQTETEKINRDYKEVRDNYKSLPQASRDMADKMFGFSIKSYLIDKLTPLPVGKLNEYASDADYQTFLKANAATQKANLDLFKSNFDLILNQTKESLENILNYIEKIVKWGEEFIAEMKKNAGSNPYAALNISNLQLEVDKQKTATIWGKGKFENFAQKTIAEKIKAIQEVYQELERINWKNNNQGNK